MASETATLGGGCFWCLEAAFEMLDGVERVVSGYAAGHVDAPTYEQVCAGTTGHAEVVQITYDPARISFEDLLDVFFSIHDPTTKDRQGNDVGTQYRSIVLYHDDRQREAAEAAIARLEKEGVWDAPIVTQVEALTRLWPAEEYHQGYYRRNPGQGYCMAVVRPKVAKMRSAWASRLKPDAA